MKLEHYQDQNLALMVEKITYNTDLVGEGLKENYDNIAKSFNESQGGNYKGLIEGAINVFTRQIPIRHNNC